MKKVKFYRKKTRLTKNQNYFCDDTLMTFVYFMVQLYIIGTLVYDLHQKILLLIKNNVVNH